MQYKVRGQALHRHVRTILTVYVIFRMLLHKTLVYSNDSEVLQTVVHKVYRMCHFHGYRYTCTLVCTNKRFTCIHVYVVHR